MTVLLVILAVGLLLRALFLAALTVRYRGREGVPVASVHVGMLASAGVLASVASVYEHARLYLVLACGIVLAADLFVRRLLTGEPQRQRSGPR